MKWILVALLLSIGLTACNNSDFLKEITLSEPDLSKVSDGVYRGEYTLTIPFGQMVAYPSATMDVKVSNHRYEELTIVNLSNFNTNEGFIDYFNRVKLEQKINIDGISGASYTSIAVKKAIENAFVK